MGAPDVDGMLDGMSSRQFAEWMAFAKVEPFGGWAEDRRHALTVHMQAEIHRNRDRRPQPFEVEQFLPFNPPKAKAGDTRLLRAWMTSLVKGD